MGLDGFLNSSFFTRDVLRNLVQIRMVYVRLELNTCRTPLRCAPM